MANPSPSRLRAGLCALALLLPAGATRAAEPLYGQDDFVRVRKFDAHVHANTEDGAFLAQARADNFELLSINVDYPDFPSLEVQRRTAVDLAKRDPRRFHYAATFSMDGWGKAGWAEATVAGLKRDVEGGAVAVKVWKNVGMSVRGADGKLVMIDDPGFDPVAAGVQSLGVPLIMHQGEPKNCWLPLDAMTTDNDREYFQAHPQYYMYLHPEMPSYETLMAARDRFVARHPALPVVGAHMASLEWSVDALAAFLDAHPKAVVDLAARMTQVQFQSATEPEKVRAFFIRYADRLLYGTDLTFGPEDDPAAFARQAHDAWRSDWTYLATAESQPIDALKRDVPGLGLPRPVIDKIYWRNAHRVFSRLGGKP